MMQVMVRLNLINQGCYLLNDYERHNYQFDSLCKPVITLVSVAQAGSIQQIFFRDGVYLINHGKRQTSITLQFNFITHDKVMKYTHCHDIARDQLNDMGSCDEN